MKTKLIKVAAVASAVIFSAGGAWAQEGQQEQNLRTVPVEEVLAFDLETAIDIALSTNPTIKTAEMEVERYDYVRKEAMGNHLPTLAVGGQFAFNIVKQEMAKGLSFGADMAASVTADLTIPLFAPAIYSTMKMTRTQQELAVEQARSSKIELVSSVKKAFFQVLLLQKSYEVLKASDATIRQTVENTRTMFSSGLASEYDLLTAEVQLSNLQPSIISVGNSISVAKQMVKMFLSIPENVDIELAGSLDDFRDAGFDAAYGAPVDLDNNSELRQLEYQHLLVRQQIKLANTGYIPTIAAYGSLMVTGQDKTTDFAGMMTGGSGTINKWWWQNPLSAGIRVSIPIFTGLKEHYKVKQLQNTVSQIELQKDYLREAKQLEAHTAMNALVSARETMIANEKTVAQAEKAYEISRTRFDAGAGTMLEVNQAQLNVTQSRLNHSQAIYDLLAAQADYDRVTGKEQ